MSFAEALTIVFVILKLVGVITWDWIWVLSPLWIWLIISLIILFIIWLFDMLEG